MLWVLGITLLGYFLGGIEFLQENLEATVLLIVAVLGDADGLGVVAAPGAGRGQRRARDADLARDIDEPAAG